MPASSTDNPASGESVFTKQSQFTPCADAPPAQNSHPGVNPAGATRIGGWASVSSTSRWGWAFCSYKTAAARLVGLDYAQNRYYSPQIARFTTADPYRHSAKGRRPQSWNRYAYVMNDPINHSDPSGLTAGPDCLEDDDECNFLLAIDEGNGGFGGATSGEGDGVGTDPASGSGGYGEGGGSDLGSGGDDASEGGADPVGVNHTSSEITAYDSDGNPIIGDQSNGVSVTVNGNGDEVLPNGDKPIYGWMGQGGAIIRTVGVQATHDMGCVGLGWAFEGPAIAASAAIIPKPFSQGGTSGTSIWSWFFGGGKIGKGVTSPVGTPGVNLVWQKSPFLGRIIGRYLPYIGLVVGSVAIVDCVSSHP